MSISYRLNNQTIRLDEVPDLVAVRPLKSHQGNVEAEIQGIGSRYSPSPDDKSIPGGEVRSFEAAGWIFVRPQDKTATTRRPVNPSLFVGRVFLNENWHLCIGTYRLTVKLREDLTESEVHSIFDQYKLNIIRKLGFAPNLFTVEVTGDRDVFEVASELEQRSEFIAVEPQMLEHISTR